MTSLIISKKECFDQYRVFCENHPERPKNKKVTIEDIEEILSDNVLFTRQPSSKSKA